MGGIGKGKGGMGGGKGKGGSQKQMGGKGKGKGGYKGQDKGKGKLRRDDEVRIEAFSAAMIQATEAHKILEALHKSLEAPLQQIEAHTAAGSEWLETLSARMFSDELRSMKADMEAHEAVRLSMIAWTTYWAVIGDPGFILRALQDTMGHLAPTLMRWAGAEGPKQIFVGMRLVVFESVRRVLHASKWPGAYMHLVAAVRDIEAELVSDPEEHHMKLLSWATDEVLMTMADNIKSEESKIQNFPHWDEVVKAPFAYQLLSLRAHEDPKQKVFDYMSYDELVWVENVARSDAGHEAIDGDWWPKQRTQARQGPGIFEGY